MQKIVPHLWYDKEAGEAARFYTTVFKDAYIKSTVTLRNTPSGTVELLTVVITGQEFMLISAGPFFKFTPAVSFLVACSTKGEVERLWAELFNGGKALMPLDSYPFSQKYGWLEDKYGLSWQLMYFDKQLPQQKITPTIMFVGEQCGKAEEALRFYTTVFQNAKLGDISRYGADEAPDKESTIRHASFVLEGQEFAAMDSAYKHDFNFNEAISLVVKCDTQAEIDYYWDKLTAYPEAEQCGWLKDKYGLSWQIAPSIMDKMMEESTPEKMDRITAAFLKMKKFDLAELIKAGDV